MKTKTNQALSILTIWIICLYASCVASVHMKNIVLTYIFFVTIAFMYSFIILVEKRLLTVTLILVELLLVLVGGMLHSISDNNDIYFVISNMFLLVAFLLFPILLYKNKTTNKKTISTYKTH